MKRLRICIGVIVAVILVFVFSGFTVQDKSATEADMICGKSAQNLLGNVGLWGDKNSLREMLKDAEWGQYVDFILAKNYPTECTMSILRAAVKPQKGGPLALGLFTTYTEFRTKGEKK